MTARRGRLAVGCRHQGPNLVAPWPYTSPSLKLFLLSHFLKLLPKDNRTVTLDHHIQSDFKVRECYLSLRPRVPASGRAVQGTEWEFPREPCQPNRWAFVSSPFSQALSSSHFVIHRNHRYINSTFSDSKEMCMCTPCKCSCPERPDVGTLETRVIVGHKPPDTGAGK